MSVSPSRSHACHCINPLCSQPYPQAWDHKTCQTCGVTLRLNDRYVPTQRLQTGGSTFIYAVYDLVTATERVMRVLAAATPKPLARFHQEALTLSNLYDRGLPRIDAGGYFHVRLQRGMLACLVMEKIEGATLQDVINQHPNGCSEAWVLDWLRQAAIILQKLHKRRILHGNLTPASFVLRRGNKQLAINDLGFPTALPANDDSQSKPSYKAPEQHQGEAIAPATDFYALGQVCIHLLTGRHPLTLKDAAKESNWRQRARVSPAFADLLDKLVLPERRLRPQSAIELLEQISQIPTKVPTSKLELQTSGFPAHSDMAEQSAGRSKAVAKSQRSNLVTTSMNGRINSASSSVYTQSKLLTSGDSSHTSGTPVLMSAGGSYRANRDTYRSDDRFDLETLKQHLGDAIANVGYLRKGLLQICSLLIRVMLLAGVGSGLTAALGFWVTYWSPLKPHIDAFFAYQVESPYIPLVLTPAMIVFGFAGVGTTWALTQTRNVELDQQLWGQRFMGGVGYAIAWVTWQWGATGLTITEAIARLTAITALSLSISLGTYNHLIIQAIVMMFGTSTTFSTLIKLKLWQPGLFLNLFRSANTFSPDEATFWATVNFFSLLGIVLSVWLVFNYYVTSPVLDQLGKLLKRR